MKAVIHCLAGIVVLLGLAGCKEPTAPNPTPAPSSTNPPASADLRGRLQAAMEIISVNIRDEALIKVANDAASAVQPDIAKQALSAVISVNLRDPAAAECALKLGKQGRTDAGTELAGLIVSVNTRDETLKRLATGK